MGASSAALKLEELYSVERTARAGNEQRSITLASGTNVTVDSQLDVHLTRLFGSNAGEPQSMNPSTTAAAIPITRIGVSGPSTENISFRQWIRSRGEFTVAFGDGERTMSFQGGYRTGLGTDYNFPRDGFGVWQSDADISRADDGRYPDHNGAYSRETTGGVEEYSMYDAPIANQALTRFFEQNPMARRATRASVTQELRTEIVEGNNVTAVVRWNVVTTAVRGRVAAESLPDGAQVVHYSQRLNLTYYRQVHIDSVQETGPTPVDPPAQPAESE